MDPEFSKILPLIVEKVPFHKKPTTTDELKKYVKEIYIKRDYIFVEFNPGCVIDNDPDGFFAISMRTGLHMPRYQRAGYTMDRVKDCKFAPFMDAIEREFEDKFGQLCRTLRTSNAVERYVDHLVETNDEITDGEVMRSLSTMHNMVQLAARVAISSAAKRRGVANKKRRAPSRPTPSKDCSQKPSDSTGCMTHVNAAPFRTLADYMLVSACAENELADQIASLIVSAVPPEFAKDAAIFCIHCPWQHWPFPRNVCHYTVPLSTYMVINALWKMVPGADAGDPCMVVVNENEYSVTTEQRDAVRSFTELFTSTGELRPLMYITGD